MQVKAVLCKEAIYDGNEKGQNYLFIPEGNCIIAVFFSLSSFLSNYHKIS